MKFENNIERFIIGAFFVLFLGATIIIPYGIIKELVVEYGTLGYFLVPLGIFVFIIIGYIIKKIFPKFGIYEKEVKM